MSRINRLPWGLQDLLGSNSQGDNPSELMQDVRPQFDMLPLWAVERITFANAFRADAGAPGSSIQIVIPTGEMWIPLWLSGFVSASTIGDEFGVTLIMLDPEKTLTVSLVSPTYRIVTAATEEVHASVGFPQRTLYRAGTEFGILCNAFTVAAGVRQLRARMQYIKLQT